MNDAFTSAGVDKTSVDAYWLGTALSGASGMMLSKPLELSGQPVVRVEMTFRRLSVADGIINYFWKARPLAVDAHEGDA